MLADIAEHLPVTTATVGMPKPLLRDQVGLTTVYRTLHALAQAGLVHAFTRDGELTRGTAVTPPAHCG